MLWQAPTPRNPPLTCVESSRFIAVGELPLVWTLEDARGDRRQNPVDLLRTLDDPVAVGEAHQQAVDESQCHVAQILDYGRVQFGAVRHELYEDLLVQLGESIGGLLQDHRQRRVADR